MKSGAALYQDNCVGCHGWDGKGEKLIFRHWPATPSWFNPAPKA